MRRQCEVRLHQNRRRAAANEREGGPRPVKRDLPCGERRFKAASHDPAPTERPRMPAQPRNLLRDGDGKPIAVRGSAGSWARQALLGDR